MKPTLPEGYTAKYKHIRHSYTLFPSVDRVRILSPRGGETICFILNQENVVVANGTAKCSPEDNYNKATGRNIALGRALKSMEDILGYNPLKRGK